MRLATAFCTAQRWIRALTCAELKRLLDGYCAALGEQFSWRDLDIEGSDDRPFADPDDRPFAEPYFWAAFVFFGT
jgi:CHAT domain-containing protein